MEPPSASLRPSSAQAVKTNNRQTIRDSTAGADEGYHGLRIPEQCRNKRLYGNAPCMRSNVDDVVFGRDFDMSDSKHHSAEMLHLFTSFRGAAGKQGSMQDLLSGEKETERYCCRTEKSMNIDWKTHAGRKNGAYKEGKKVWGKHWQSNVGNAVFGQETSDTQTQVRHGERDFRGKFLHAGGLSSTYSREPDAKLHTSKNKRIYHGCPMNVSQMDCVMHNQTGANVTPRRKDGPEEQYLNEQFRDAAGLSPRFHRAAASSVRECLDNAVCIYR